LAARKEQAKNNAIERQLGLKIKAKKLKAAKKE